MSLYNEDLYVHKCTVKLCRMLKLKYNDYDVKPVRSSDWNVNGYTRLDILTDHSYIDETRKKIRIVYDKMDKEFFLQNWEVLSFYEDYTVKVDMETMDTMSIVSKMCVGCAILFAARIVIDIVKDLQQ